MLSGAHVDVSSFQAGRTSQLCTRLPTDPGRLQHGRSYDRSLLWIDAAERRNNQHDPLCRQSVLSRRRFSQPRRFRSQLDLRRSQSAVSLLFSYVWSGTYDHLTIKFIVRRSLLRNSYDCEINHRPTMISGELNDRRDRSHDNLRTNLRVFCSCFFGVMID